MVSNRQRRKALARAKWQRQQARRTAAQRRARMLSIVGGSVAAVVAVVALGWGVSVIIKDSNNSPGSTVTTPVDSNFPSLLQPTNPGLTVTSFNPGTPTTAPTGGTTAPTPTAPVTTDTTGTGK